MVHFEESYKYGKAKEEIILPVLKEYFSREIINTTEKYAKYDYYDDSYKYELKSRTNKKNTYPDTMITFNKCTDEFPLILLFNYTDCLCYIEYNKDKFKNYKKKLFSRANIITDEKEHVYIPIEDLTVIKIF